MRRRTLFLLITTLFRKCKFQTIFVCILHSQTWTAEVTSTSADKTEYVLTNKDFDGDIQAGSEFKVEFNGLASGDTAPTATLTMNGGGGSTGGNQNTQAPQTGGNQNTQSPQTGGNPITPAPHIGGGGMQI